MISSRVRKHHKKHNTPRYINYANYTSKGYGFTHSAMVIHGIKALLVSSTAIGSFNIKYDIQLLCIIFDAKNSFNSNSGYTKSSDKIFSKP